MTTIKETFTIETNKSTFTTTNVDDSTTNNDVTPSLINTQFYTSLIDQNQNQNQTTLDLTLTSRTSFRNELSTTVKSTALPSDYVGLVYTFDQLDIYGLISTVHTINVFNENLIVSSKQLTIFVADYILGKVRFDKRGHDDHIRALISYSEYDIFITGSDDKLIKIWNASTGDCLHIFDSSNGGHNGYVRFMIRLDNNLFASGSSISDPTVKVWNVTSRSLVWNMNNVYLINGLVSLGYDHLIAAVSSRDIKIWNTLTGNLTKTISIGNVKSIVSIKSNPHLLASGELTGIIRVWNITSGLEILKLNGHTSQVNILLSLESDLIVSGSWDASIRVWNLTTGQNQYIFNKTNGGHVGGTITALTLLKNGLLASAGGGDFDIRIWDLNVGSLKHRFNQSIGGHFQSVAVLTYLRDDLFASGATRGTFTEFNDGTVKIWNVT
jgi:WD40 repeat protein